MAAQLVTIPLEVPAQPPRGRGFMGWNGSPGSSRSQGHMFRGRGWSMMQYDSTNSSGFPRAVPSDRLQNQEV